MTRPRAGVARLIFALVAIGGTALLAPAQPPVQPTASGPEDVAHRPIAWPARYTTKDRKDFVVVRPLSTPADELTPSRVPSGGIPQPGLEDLADFRELVGEGAKALEAKLTLEGANAFLFVPKQAKNKGGIGAGPGTQAGPSTLAFKTISAEQSTEGTLALQRCFFAYYSTWSARGSDHRPPALPPPLRAVVLIMPGIFGNPDPAIDALTWHLRTRGIGVLRMCAQPSRFTERIELEIDPANPEPSAKLLGEVNFQRTADCAYHVEAAWKYLHEKHPETKALPHAVIGMSGGAITLPGVVAREPAIYKAFVIIGGGSNFWRISRESNYRFHIDALRFRWKTPPTADQIDTLDRAYLDHNPLDSFHTAAGLKGSKVLVLQGLTDQAVPAAAGQELWERLGTPERWEYPVGHELLFGALPSEFDRLTAWLEQAMSLRGRRPPGGTP